MISHELLQKQLYDVGMIPSMTFDAILVFKY